MQVRLLPGALNGSFASAPLGTKSEGRDPGPVGLAALFRRSFLLLGLRHPIRSAYSENVFSFRLLISR